LPRESHPGEEALVNTNKKAGKKTRFRITDYSLNSIICRKNSRSILQNIMPTIRRRSTIHLPVANNLKKGIRNFSGLHGAGNGIRTRDTKLGKLVLYQLSYARL
jgi:hypothetical protein